MTWQVNKDRIKRKWKRGKVREAEKKVGVNVKEENEEERRKGGGRKRVRRKRNRTKKNENTNKTDEKKEVKNTEEESFKRRRRTPKNKQSKELMNRAVIGSLASPRAASIAPEATRNQIVPRRGGLGRTRCQAKPWEKPGQNILVTMRGSWCSGGRGGGAWG